MGIFNDLMEIFKDVSDVALAPVKVLTGTVRTVTRQVSDTVNEIVDEIITESAEGENDPGKR